MGATSQIGFHATYQIERGEVSTSSVGNALIGAYLATIGLSNDAIVYITQARPTEMTWLNIGEARQHGIQVLIFAPVASVVPQENQRERDEVAPAALPSKPNAAQTLPLPGSPPSPDYSPRLAGVAQTLDRP